MSDELEKQAIGDLCRILGFFHPEEWDLVSLAFPAKMRIERLTQRNELLESQLSAARAEGYKQALEDVMTSIVNLQTIRIYIDGHKIADVIDQLKSDCEKGSDDEHKSV